MFFLAVLIRGMTSVAAIFGGRFMVRLWMRRWLFAIREQSTQRIWRGRLTKYVLNYSPVTSRSSFLLNIVLYQYGGGYFIKYNGQSVILVFLSTTHPDDSINHLENMKWMYIRDQGPEDIFIFRQYDNSKTPVSST